MVASASFEEGRVFLPLDVKLGDQSGVSDTLHREGIKDRKSILASVKFFKLNDIWRYCPLSPGNQISTRELPKHSMETMHHLKTHFSMSTGIHDTQAPEAQVTHSWCIIL